MGGRWEGGREGGPPVKARTHHLTPPTIHPPVGRRNPPRGLAPVSMRYGSSTGGPSPRGDTPTAGYVGGSTRWRVSVPPLHQRFLQPADLIGGFLAQGIVRPVRGGFVPLLQTCCEYFVIAGVESTMETNTGTLGLASQHEIPRRVGLGSAGSTLIFFM